MHRRTAPETEMKISAETEAVWKDLAGPLYDELVQSTQAAMAHLFDPSSDIRFVALDICDRLWDCSGDVEFVDACRQIAATDPDDSVRARAIESFGKAFRSSKNPSASQFLADIVKDSKRSDGVRTTAFRALREIQLGLTEDDEMKRTISLMKASLRKIPWLMSEDEARHILLGAGYYPNMDWDSVDEIDWAFVDQYASRH